jgi:hypothetical protein
MALLPQLGGQTLDEKIENDYNPHLKNLVPGIIPIDNKTYNSLS